MHPHELAATQTKKAQACSAGLLFASANVLAFAGAQNSFGWSGETKLVA
jgi:hypothetical protein